MPNWCENHLRVSGDEKVIQAFKKKAKRSWTALSFDRFVPMPEELAGINVGSNWINGVAYRLWRGSDDNEVGLDPKEVAELEKMHGTAVWFDWCEKHWGTMRDVHARLIVDTDDCLEYEFDTAWSPPIKWLKKVSEQYPQLHFAVKYDEPNMGFRGRAVAKNGVVKE